MLYEHPKVESDSARIRLAGFDKGALSLEIFSYIITRDQAEFSAICEDVWLRMMEIVENSGSGFVGPSQTVHLSAIPASIRRKPWPPSSRSSNGGINTNCRSPISRPPTNQPFAVRFSILRPSRRSEKTNAFPKL